MKHDLNKTQHNLNSSIHEKDHMKQKLERY